MRIKDKIKNTEIDMTTGEPYKLLISFSLPLLVGNILQQLYNIADTIIVGQYVGKDALAAVGTSYPIIFLFNSLFMGLSMGAMIVISRFYGAKDKENLQNTVDTVYNAFVVLALVMTFLGIIFTKQIMQAINVPPETLDMATLYMRITFYGMLATLGFNINSGILQGIGDTVSTTIYLLIAVVLNIGLDLLFVAAFDFGVAGAAWATIIAQFIAFAFGYIHINVRSQHIKVKLINKNFHMPILKECLRLGMPSALQNAVFSVGVLTMQRLINSFGTDFIAGYTAGQKIDSLAFLPMLSYGNAITAYVGQNIGAGKNERIDKGVKQCLILAAATCITLSIPVIIFGEHFLMLFNTDPNVIEEGMAYLYREVPPMFLLGMMITYNSALRGAGRAMVPMFVSLFSLWLGRIPFAHYFAAKFGARELYWSFAVGWVIGLAIDAVYYNRGIRNGTLVKAYGADIK